MFGLILRLNTKSFDLLLQLELWCGGCVNRNIHSFIGGPTCTRDVFEVEWQPEKNQNSAEIDFLMKYWNLPLLKPFLVHAPLSSHYDGRI